MDAVAALTAPLLADVDVPGLSEFLGRRGLAVLHAHRGAPFGVLLKALLHGRLGTDLRCGRLALNDAGAEHPVLSKMVGIAGQAGESPPPGYYLFKGDVLVGYHPELAEPDAMVDLVLAGARGVRVLLAQRDPGLAGRAALQGREELDVLRFFEDTAQGWTPRRAPAAPDRRGRADRRAGARGAPRRAGELFVAELESACALLGVDPSTPLRQVKAARNRLMRDNHPDRLAHHPERQGEATRLTVQINRAFAVIASARGVDGA